jgi:hypothetical protein
MEEEMTCEEIVQDMFEKLGKDRVFNWIRRDIENADRHGLAGGLRISARKGFDLPPDIINILADFLDPAIKKRRGPKRGCQDTWQRELIKSHACMEFSALCEYPEWARQWLHNKEKAFQLVVVLNSSGETINWDFKKEPPWKFPELEPIRKRASYPSRGELKDYICETYDLSSRTFDDLISDFRKNPDVIGDFHGHSF